MAPLVLSRIIRRLEQNATVTQVTARREDMSCPPTQPLMTASDTVAPAARSAERKESSYTFLRKVAYSTSRMTGVISEEKNIPLSLKYILELRLTSAHNPVISDRLPSAPCR